jgi:hypothetical protein
MKLLQRWKQTAVHNRALALTSVLVAFGTLFYAGAAVFQVWLVAQSSKHTDEQLGWVIGNVNWLARSMDLSEKEAEKGIEASALQNEKALNLAERQFALAQRPWVQVDTTMVLHQASTVWAGNDSNGKEIIKSTTALMKFPNQMILDNFPTDFAANFKNVGLSPAINEWGFIQMDFIDLPAWTMHPGYFHAQMPIPPSCRPGPAPQKSKFVVFPGIPYSFSGAQLPSTANVEGWVHWKKVLIVHGCIKYEDEIGGTHQTNFCSIFDRIEHPAQAQWISCPNGNEAW